MNKYLQINHILIDRSDDQQLYNSELKNLHNVPQNRSSIVRQTGIYIKDYLIIYGLNILLIVILG